MLGFDVIDSLDVELKEMNKDKVGLGTISYLIHFFSYLDIPRYTFIFHIDKQRVLHKDMLKGKYLIFQITVQLAEEYADWI